MMNEKCVRSPQFSPHPPHELFLSCVNSIISGWYSCLLESLPAQDRKSTRLNSSHGYISYAVFCLKKKKNITSHVSFTTKHRATSTGGPPSIHRTTTPPIRVMYVPPCDARRIAARPLVSQRPFSHA